MSNKFVLRLATLKDWTMICGEGGGGKSEGGNKKTIDLGKLGGVEKKENRKENALSRYEHSNSKRALSATKCIN
jgi:hypothetical protein